MRELENDRGIPTTTVWEILNKILGMTRVCAKFIPKFLTTEQKDLRSEIAQDNSEMVSDDENVVKKVITDDKSWDPEIKQQFSQWKRPDEPRPKNARQIRSHVKSMLIIFFDCEGVVNYEFAPRGQTINKEYYFEVLKKKKAIPKSAFEDCFKMWKHRWERVVQSNGDYFKECLSPDGEESHQRGDMNVGRILFGHTSYT